MNDLAHPLVRMAGINKSFGGVKVLDDVTFEIGRGEIVALLGANGAGKSTLMKILTGVYHADDGTTFRNGTEVTITSPRAASRAGISFLPQEVSVIPEMTVAENICLGIMPELGRGPVSNTSAMRSKAREVLAELGFEHVSVDALIGSLPVGEQRIVEIARALSGSAEVLVMDEPTAALSEKDSALLFTVLKRLRDAGASIVYISHYLSEVFEISDRIVVLRDGRLAGAFSTKETTIDVVLSAMLGRNTQKLFEERDDSAGSGPVVFSARGLSWKDKLHDLNMDVRSGEILGIFGLVGSGIEHLGRVIYGVERSRVTGEMAVSGKPYLPTGPIQAKAAGIGFVTAERKTEGILAELSVAQNLAASFWTDYGSRGLASSAQENKHALNWISRLGIVTTGPGQPMRFLSGGNQQKVCVARWLHPSMMFVILEEPTRGVDIGARKDIYKQLAGFADEGMAILVLSSDAEEIAGLSDRAMVIDRGRIVRNWQDAREVDAAALLAATADNPATLEEVR